MERNSIVAIVRSLNQAGVRYLIAGGLAVVAHGYVRLTADLDLILDFREDNLRRAVAAFAELGYTPRAPVPFEQFLDAGHRAAWQREKGLRVFSLASPLHPATEVDLFVEMPLDFDQAYAAAVPMEVAAGLPATFVSFDDLLFLKEQAGRPRDRDDIARLQLIRTEAAHE